MDCDVSVSDLIRNSRPISIIETPEAHNQKHLYPVLELTLRLTGMSTKQPAIARVLRSNQRSAYALIQVILDHGNPEKKRTFFDRYLFKCD